jgi:hypothetical protein
MNAAGGQFRMSLNEMRHGNARVQVTAVIQPQGGHYWSLHRRAIGNP